jgi:hypothetical protein
MNWGRKRRSLRLFVIKNYSKDLRAESQDFDNV